MLVSSLEAHCFYKIVLIKKACIYLREAGEITVHWLMGRFVIREDTPRVSQFLTGYFFYTFNKKVNIFTRRKTSAGIVITVSFISRRSIFVSKKVSEINVIIVLYFEKVETQQCEMKEEDNPEDCVIFL